MATKNQGAGEWTSTGGLGARRLIAAFAERQWRLGERLSYHDINVVTGDGPESNGGSAAVVATFGDGTVQPMTFVKFIYNCSARAFSHAVMISAEAAGHDRRG